MKFTLFKDGVALLDEQTMSYKVDETSFSFQRIFEAMFKYGLRLFDNLENSKVFSAVKLVLDYLDPA